MGKINIKKADEVEAERQEAERRKRIEGKRASIKAELAQTRPKDDQDGLEARQEKVEIALGLRDPEEDRSVS